jgi:hypothetical protein
MEELRLEIVALRYPGKRGNGKGKIRPLRNRGVEHSCLALTLETQLPLWDYVDREESF